ncbi:MAG: DUF2318 domain-containing protein [Oscillospiraceae bacterium]|jgi:hypothetical protein|nr:DUF2318 domain-containing protein [Oscillospiraceae bacterium]
MRTEFFAYSKAAKKKGAFFILAVSIALALALAACSASGSADEPGGAGNNAEISTENGGGAESEAPEDDGQTIKDGESLVILADEISETPKFYPLTVDGTRMEVFAVKAGDGTIRTAFNTCQVCSGSPKAYFEQSGNTVQCQNCGNKFPMERVGIESGGCNPVPILDDEKTVTEESVTVPYASLRANVYRFTENWKR